MKSSETSKTGEGSKFEVSGTSNPELRPSNLASHVSL